MTNIDLKRGFSLSPTNTLGNAGLQKKKSLHTNCVAAIGAAGNIWLNPGDSGLTSCGLLFRFLKVSIKTVKSYQTFTQTVSSHNSHIKKIINEQRHPFVSSWLDVLLLPQKTLPFLHADKYRSHLQSPNMSSCHQTPS